MIIVTRNSAQLLAVSELVMSDSCNRIPKQGLPWVPEIEKESAEDQESPDTVPHCQRTYRISQSYRTTSERSQMTVHDG